MHHYLIGLIIDRKSTRLNSSHLVISYAVFCLKKKTERLNHTHPAYLPVERCVHARAVRSWMRTRLAPRPRPAAVQLAAIRLPIFFFFNDTATTEIYTLSLHDALPI